MLHTHPSPARLGLPSTTAAAPVAATATAGGPSPSLLPLLPPLSRAQSLLSHLANLTSLLFELSPHRPFFLSSYRGSLPSFLPDTPPPPPPLPATPKEVLAAATAVQTQLFESVAQLQEILDLQDANFRVARQVRAFDAAFLAFANKLHRAQDHLSLLIDDYSDQYPRKRARHAGDGEVEVGFGDLKLSDVLAYAHRISYTTFAPPEFGAGQAPLRGALPPAPQDEQMRASLLYKAGELDLGLPKEEPAAAAVERLIDTVVPAPAPPQVELLRGMSIPPIPSGWRPGMPIELPSELLIMPPGWKPGDPVALPPLDGGVAVPPAVFGEEARPAALAQPKAAEPIQVRYVELDINPDQDEYSSDYSSEEGSSEEDDED